MANNQNENSHQMNMFTLEQTTDSIHQMTDKRCENCHPMNLFIIENLLISFIRWLTTGMKIAIR